MFVLGSTLPLLLPSADRIVLFATVLALVVAGDSQSDGVEPSRELISRVKAIQMMEGAKECLLANVFRIIASSVEAPHQKLIKSRSKAFGQFSHGIRAAGKGAPRQFIGIDPPFGFVNRPAAFEHHLD